MQTMSTPPLLALVFAFTACAHAPTFSESEVRARIEERLRVFTDANLAANLEGMVSPFREDAVMLRPTGTWEGKAAIRAGYEKILTQSRVVALQVRTESVRVSGERAYELGTIRGEREDTHGVRTPTVGRYLTVWRREPDGRWLIEVDSLHFDAPPKP